MLSHFKLALKVKVLVTQSCLTFSCQTELSGSLRGIRQLINCNAAYLQSNQVT